MFRGRAPPTPTAKTAKVMLEAQMPARATAEDVTASIRPPPVPRPKPSETPHATAQPVAEANAEPTRAHPTTILTARRDKDRYLPAVVDSYNGAHIITVCAALTENEQLHAGCP